MVDSDSDFMKEAFNRVKDLYLEGKWDEAKSGMAEVLQRQSDHSEAAYWLTDCSDSPWYPTTRLFRQPRHGDWESVIADVTSALQRIWPL